MPIKIGYKLCIDCKTPIKKSGKRVRCEKCQLAHYLKLEEAKRAIRVKPKRIVSCDICQSEFVARSNNHKTCDNCHQARATTYQPTRVKQERISALPLASLQGDRFARAVTAYIQAANG